MLERLVLGLNKLNKITKKGSIVNIKAILLLGCFLGGVFFAEGEVFNVTECRMADGGHGAFCSVVSAEGMTVGDLKAAFIRDCGDRFDFDLVSSGFYLKCKNFSTGEDEIVYDREILSTLFARKFVVEFSTIPLGLYLPEEILDFGAGKSPNMWLVMALLQHKTFLAQRLEKAIAAE